MDEFDKTILQLVDIGEPQDGDMFPVAREGVAEDNKMSVLSLKNFINKEPLALIDELSGAHCDYELEQSSSPQFVRSNTETAEHYAANMGGYLFYVKNGTVYAAKMSNTRWTAFEDGNEITAEIRAATETMIHVPDCYFKGAGKKMRFGGIFPVVEGQKFDSPHWVGAYQISLDANNVAHSRPGVGSSHSKTMSQFWDYAQALHTDFGLANYEFNNLINALYQALKGNLNSEYVLSDGNSRSSASWDAFRDLEHGKADSIANGTGCVAAVDGAGVTRYVTKLCGFEDLFGKLWEFRPGIRFYMDNGVRYAVVYSGNQVSNTAQGRLISNVLQSASGQYTTSMELGAHWDMLPKAVGGGDPTYYCDGYWASAGGELLLVGGSADDGSLCGLSYASSYNGFSYAYGGIGARLAFYSEPVIVTGAELIALMS